VPTSSRTTSVRAVIERAHRPVGSEDCYDAARRAGAFVGRLGPRRATPEDDWRSWRGVDLAAPGEEQRLAAGRGTTPAGCAST
jgi:hypothetical protein